MKKCFVLSLLLSMLLCGCSSENTPETDATDAAATTEAAQDTTAAEPPTEKATEAPTEAETEPQRSWQEIYAEVIREQQAAAENPDAMEYDLIYIDADDVPELYVSQGMEYKGVYTILDDSAAELHPMTYYRDVGFDSYEERQGVYYTSSDGGAGHGSIEVWYVENGVAELTDDYRFDINSTGDDTDYFHNNVSCTQEEFNSILGKKLNEGQSPSGVSFAEIMREIGYTTETWQEAYSHTAENFELWLKEEVGMEESDAEYSLIYIDNDDTPELLIDSYAMQELYTFLHGTAVCVNNSGSYRNNHFSGYQEKSGQYWIYDSAGSDNWYLTVMQLKNGNTQHVETLGCDSALQNEYHMGYQQITKEEAEQKLSEYREMETEYETFTYAEMLGILAE